jgi:hypothetical protein
MDVQNEILRTLGRIEGRLESLCTLPARVRTLELWHNRLKGAWTALAGAYLYLFRGAWGK